MVTKKKATPAATPAARTFTADEAELLDIVRPWTRSILGANRERTRRHLQGGSWTLAGMVETFGFRAFWMPEFWFWMDAVFQEASTDPKWIAERFPDDDQVANVEGWRAKSNEKREELEQLFKVLLGTRGRGRTKDKPAKDYAARAAMVETKAAELRAQGEKKVLGKARAIVAKAENVTPETLRKDKKRAKRGK